MTKEDSDRFKSVRLLLGKNRDWAEQQTQRDPNYFEQLSKGQNPPFLMLGCSDSRKPLNVITGAAPGELLVYRNVGNQVVPGDPGALAVLEFAVEVLKVEHVIVCGHSNCGAVHAAVTHSAPELTARWIAPITKLAQDRHEELSSTSDDDERAEMLGHWNVHQQLRNVALTSVMRQAFASGKYPLLHGWYFQISNGLIEELALPFKEWKAEGLLPADYPEQTSKGQA